MDREVFWFYYKCWTARSFDGRLNRYRNCPHRTGNGGWTDIPDSDIDNGVPVINEWLFPDITYENSPKEIDFEQLEQNYKY